MDDTWRATSRSRMRAGLENRCPIARNKRTPGEEQQPGLCAWSGRIPWRFSPGGNRACTRCLGDAPRNCPKNHSFFFSDRRKLRDQFGRPCERRIAFGGARFAFFPSAEPEKQEQLHGQGRGTVEEHIVNRAGSRKQEGLVPLVEAGCQSCHEKRCARPGDRPARISDAG